MVTTQHDLRLNVLLNISLKSRTIPFDIRLQYFAQCLHLLSGILGHLLVVYQLLHLIEILQTTGFVGKAVSREIGDKIVVLGIR